MGTCASRLNPHSLKPKPHLNLPPAPGGQTEKGCSKRKAYTLPEIPLPYLQLQPYAPRPLSLVALFGVLRLGPGLLLGSDDQITIKKVLLFPVGYPTAMFEVLVMALAWIPFQLCLTLKLGSKIWGVGGWGSRIHGRGPCRAPHFLNLCQDSFFGDCRV